MIENVIPMPDTLERLALGINQRVVNIKKRDAESDEDWIAIAIMTAQARDRHKDDISFGRWWGASIVGLNEHERAALVAMGRDPARMRAMLRASSRVSLRLMYANEWPRFGSAAKPSGEPGKSSEPAKPRRSPQLDEARKLARERLAAGQPVRTRETEKLFGHGTLDSAREIERIRMEAAEAIERARVETLNALHVDPATLSTTAAQKVEVAKRVMERALKAEHDARMKQIDEEVRQRVLKEGKEYRDRLEEIEERARVNEKFYRDMISAHKAIFTVVEFMTILKCLHPDNSASAETRAEAFRLFNAKKLQLTKEQ